MKTGVLAALAVFVVDATPRWVGACTPEPYNLPHDLDAAYANDTSPPGEITVTDIQVYRREGSSADGGCMGGESDCGTSSRGVVALELDVTDDLAPPDRLGYRLLVAGGQPPSGLLFPTHDVIGYQHTLELVFSANHEGPVAFDLEIRAVDLNGNVGAPTIVRIDGSLDQ